MAASLIGGLIAGGFAASSIRVSDPDATTRKALDRQFPVSVMDDNRACAAAVDVVVLAVKPQVMKQVATELADTAASHAPLFLSIAAGIRVLDLKRWLATEGAIVRTMPNTPALVQTGATGLYANAAVRSQQRQWAEAIMNTVGITVWVDIESDLDTVTAISGSGPAYYFQLMEWMVDAAKQMGLSDEAARQLTLQTALGAARMAIESGESPAVLRARVTSPGGTTEAALHSMQANGVAALIATAITAARDQAVVIGEQFGAE